VTNQAPIEASQENLAKALPDPGEGRWWKVEFRSNLSKLPMKVSLMESIRPGTKAVSTTLNYGYTYAAVRSIVSEAEEILVRVGDYEKLVGDYGIE
jgi:hypothetical protein